MRNLGGCPFSLRKTPPEECTDRAQGIWGCMQLFKTPMVNYLQHVTNQTWCHTPAKIPAQYPCQQATWTLIPHDNELNAGPHTHSGGCVVMAGLPLMHETPQEPKTNNGSPEHPQPPQQWMKYGTTHSLWGVPPPTMKPHLKQAQMKPRAKTECVVKSNYPHPHQSPPDEKTNKALHK
ncbi:hypothetical protein BS47DRAFT_1364664 [Hydnum rufescens UP504]|uniref:Uncharacterized protein n=1 Tax=Hydnum rufescens UP504 TaxID=1448309 RepID=A0A9P6DT72_9AGAM|nr:hypothetical protein BS47DRAFT_1364664 [Hydnum rufescens UP504]